MFDHVDPFIGTEATDLPPRTGLAATWWWPKPQVGNTHPGACYPLGMVSAAAYSGAYPTGYGRYGLSTEGLPPVLHERKVASGFTHFQQSGTGAIRKYYNYFRVTPMVLPLDELGTAWDLTEERAEPGWYRTTLSSGITAEITVGPKSAVHRYTFGAHANARIVVDFSLGGLSIPNGATVPLRAHLNALPHGIAQGEIVVEGAPLAVHMECDAPGWRQLLWYDRRLMPGGSRLDFDSIRPTTLRDFGIMWAGPTVSGQTIELRFGFSLRGVDQAKANLEADQAAGVGGFERRKALTSAAWRAHLDGVEVDSTSPGRRTVMATALYHSLIKPCLASDESPFWPVDGPFVFDICTMWDIYRTQLPLLIALQPERAVEIANALLHICEEEGNFPIGYRMARGADRFSRQASALAHTFLADLCELGVPGIDWDWALVHMQADLRRTYGEEYLVYGRAEPISHTLDLAFGYWCAARVAQHVGDTALAEEFRDLATGWRNAFDADTGLLRDSTYYEGGKWNYSFRLLHDMAGRIDLAGGPERFTQMLDDFFGFGAEPVSQPGVGPGVEELAAGYALNRFEGMNNEPDMEVPWAYHYVGRPDRTAQIVHAALHQTFGAGPGGLPGNDDSGGLSAWYVWASLGLFPVAGQSLFMVNTPSWSSSRLTVARGVLSVQTENFRDPGPESPPQYVQAATLDGVPLDRAWLTGAELHRGGQLMLTLGDEPNDWGTTRLPPSTSTHSTIPATQEA